MIRSHLTKLLHSLWVEKISNMKNINMKTKKKFTYIPNVFTNKLPDTKLILYDFKFFSNK